MTSSCQKRIEVLSGSNSKVLNLPNVEIKETRHFPWRAGPLGRQVVSKGIVASFRLPQFEQSDLKEIVKENVSDSWLVRVKKKTYSTTTTLDQFTLNLAKKSSTRNKHFLITQLPEIKLWFLYEAASVSRLSKLACPPLGHRYLIDEFEKVDSKSSRAQLRIKSSGEKDYLSKVGIYQPQSHKIDSGKNLVGEFWLEVALYHTGRRERMTDFHRISDRLKITKEIVVDLSNCNSLENKNKIQDEKVMEFQFGG